MSFLWNVLQAKVALGILPPPGGVRDFWPKASVEVLTLLSERTPLPDGTLEPARPQMGSPSASVSDSETTSGSKATEWLQMRARPGSPGRVPSLGGEVRDDSGAPDWPLSILPEPHTLS